MGVFSRSWEITKITFDVMMKDKELLLFPLFGGIFSLLFILTLAFPTFLVQILAGKSVVFSGLEYLVLFIIYFGLSFIAVFFNVCVVYTVKKRFEGGNSTFFEAIKFAFSKIHLIFIWSLVSATVGVLLKVLDRAAEKSGAAGKIILSIFRALLGMAWSIVTLFVVPVMVYDGLGPFDAIKKSASVFRKTWGESIVKWLGLGAVQGLFTFIGIILGVILVILSLGFGPVAIVLVIVLVVGYFIALSLLFTVANTVFDTALFVYADKGIIPSGYNQEVLFGAFKRK